VWKTRSIDNNTSIILVDTSECGPMHKCTFVVWCKFLSNNKYLQIDIISDVQAHVWNSETPICRTQNQLRNDESGPP